MRPVAAANEQQVYRPPAAGAEFEDGGAGDAPGRRSLGWRKALERNNDMVDERDEDDAVLEEAGGSAAT